jgi:hypothetical protein
VRRHLRYTLMSSISIIPRLEIDYRIDRARTPRVATSSVVLTLDFTRIPRSLAQSLDVGRSRACQPPRLTPAPQNGIPLKRHPSREGALAGFPSQTMFCGDDETLRWKRAVWPRILMRCLRIEHLRYWHELVFAGKRNRTSPYTVYIHGLYLGVN